MFRSSRLDFTQLLYAIVLLITSLIGFSQVQPPASVADIIHGEIPAVLVAQKILSCIMRISLATLLFITSVSAFRRSLSPAQYTSTEPYLVKSWLPWIGHGIHIVVRGPAQFLRSSGHNHNGILKFRAWGRYIIAISSPTAIASASRDSTKFGVYDNQKLHIIMGASDKQRFQLMYEILQKKVNPHAAHGLSPRNLFTIAVVYNSHLLKRLEDTISGDVSVVLLQDFVKRNIFSASCASFFGAHLSIDDSCKDFLTWDDGIPHIFRTLPIISCPAIKARERIVARFTQYLEDGLRNDDGGHIEGASEMISGIIKSLKGCNLRKGEMERMLTAILWGAHSNMINITSWVMCYIITNPTVSAHICYEIQDALDNKFSSIDAILQLEPEALDKGFPLITSAIKEGLRMVSLPISVREVLEDTQLVDKTGSLKIIRKGEIIVMDVLNVHYDPDIYEYPETFVVDRFCGAENQERLNKLLTPFGAGSHMCTGRHYAIHAMRVFVILFFYLYDASVPPGVSLPIPDLANSLSGTIRSKHDIPVILKRREV